MITYLSTRSCNVRGAAVLGEKLDSGISATRFDSCCSGPSESSVLGMTSLRRLRRAFWFSGTIPRRYGTNCFEFRRAWRPTHSQQISTHQHPRVSDVEILPNSFTASLPPPRPPRMTVKTASWKSFRYARTIFITVFFPSRSRNHDLSYDNPSL